MFKGAPIEVMENLEKFNRKEITEKEFDFNNALVMVGDIGNMKLKIYPSKPENLKEYQKKKKELRDNNQWEKLEKLNSIIGKNQEIKSYMKQYGEVESKNFGNYWWLNWCRKVLGSDFYAQVDKVLEEYRFKDENVSKYNIGE